MKLLSESIGGDDIIVRNINSRKIDLFKSSCLIRKLSPVSINTYLRHIRAAMNTAYEWQYLERPLKIKQIKIGYRRPIVLSHDERLKLLRYLRCTDFELYRIVVFALWTGMRREEIIKITWQNKKNNMLRVIGKGDKERNVPLLPMALHAMGRKKDIGPVFVQWHKDTLSKKFKAAAIACELPDNITFHKLRHSAATQMLTSGIPIEVVQKILGHVDMRTTQIYAHVMDDLVENELKKLMY